jgi:hypothetical protein
MDITPGQLKLLHVAPRQLGMADDDFKAMLKSLTGKASRKDLNRAQAGRVIDTLIKVYDFRVQGARKKPARRLRAVPRAGSAKVVVLPTAREMEKIAALIPLIAWRTADGYQRWLEKRMRIIHIKTAGESFRVIEGLKKMFENQMRKLYGEHWWLLAFADKGILAYIREHRPAVYR